MARTPPPAPLTRDALLARLALAERDEPSEVFGGTLRLRELTRLAFRECVQFAGVVGALTPEEITAMTPAEWEARMARVDRWHASIFAVGVIDPTTDAPAFTREEVLEFRHQAATWDEMRRIAQCVIDLSEIGTEHLEKKLEP